MAAEPNNQREYFRLSYPLRMMPTISVAGSQYNVTEISERGLRFQIKSMDSFTVGDTVSGTITFDDGGQSEVWGTIFRKDNQEVILAALEGVTFQRLVIEQRSLLRAFSQPRRP